MLTIEDIDRVIDMAHNKQIDWRGLGLVIEVRPEQWEEIRIMLKKSNHLVYDFLRGGLPLITYRNTVIMPFRSANADHP